MHSRPFRPDRTLRRFSSRVTPALLAACLGATLAGASPLDYQVLQIGTIVDHDGLEPSEKVRGNFRVRDHGAPVEVYPVRVYDPGPSFLPVTGEVLAEAAFVVDGEHPVLAESLGLGIPVVDMKFYELWIGWLGEVYQRLFYVVDIERDQLESAGVLPFLEEVCDDPQTFYSIDAGETWQVLDRGELDCLTTGHCEDDSTYIRIHVRP